MLVKLQQCVADLGWCCLSSTWIDTNARYEFICARGHVFERTAATLLYRSGGAPVCAQCEDAGLRDRWLDKLAERGGTLLNGPFTGLMRRYRIRCAAGHEWDVQGRKISEGRWCPDCARTESKHRGWHADSLMQLQAAAQAKDGRCLSTEYTVRGRKYKFECAHGHRWEAKASDIFRGTWCSRCAKLISAGQVDPNGLVRLEAAARRRGGVCLATAYHGAGKKYPFRCAAGHEWLAIASQVWLGHWCRQCANLKRRHTIEDMQDLAAMRGGLCLSTEYRGRRVKLMWQCHRGHTWETRPVNISAGKWCPQCAILGRVRVTNNSS